MELPRRVHEQTQYEKRIYREGKLRYGENMGGLSEKQQKAVEKFKEIDPECEVFWDSEAKIPRFIKGTLSTPSVESHEEIASRFLEEYSELSDMQQGLEENLEVFTVEMDITGFHHVIFLQHIKISLFLRVRSRSI